LNAILYFSVLSFIHIFVGEQPDYVATLLSFGLDIAALLVVLRYFWKIYLYGD